MHLINTMHTTAAHVLLMFNTVNSTWCLTALEDSLCETSKIPLNASVLVICQYDNKIICSGIRMQTVSKTSKMKYDLNYCLKKITSNNYKCAFKP